jgi:hypothetical protein
MSAPFAVRQVGVRCCSSIIYQIGLNLQTPLVLFSRAPKQGKQFLYIAPANAVFKEVYSWRTVYLLQARKPGLNFFFSNVAPSGSNLTENGGPSWTIRAVAREFLQLVHYPLLEARDFVTLETKSSCVKNISLTIEPCSERAAQLLHVPPVIRVEILEHIANNVFAACQRQDNEGLHSNEGETGRGISSS